MVYTEEPAGNICHIQTLSLLVQRVYNKTAMEIRDEGSFPSFIFIHVRQDWDMFLFFPHMDLNSSWMLIFHPIFALIWSDFLICTGEAYSKLPLWECWFIWVMYQCRKYYRKAKTKPEVWSFSVQHVFFYDLYDTVSNQLHIQQKLNICIWIKYTIWPW